MGEVYLAQDTSLNRKVALKVLPAEVASNQDRMRRFKQEATSAASLNHPNIAHIYEVGRHPVTTSSRWNTSMAPPCETRFTTNRKNSQNCSAFCSTSPKDSPKHTTQASSIAISSPIT